MTRAFARIVLTGLVCFAGCGLGDNETPASFDPKELALVRVEPGDGQSDVPLNQPIRLIFTTTVLPASVTDLSIRVRTGGTFQTRPEGSFLVSGNVVAFEPTVSQTGGPHEIGFQAGTQILVEVPLKIPNDGLQSNLFVQNVEGNPIAAASAKNKITFTTGCSWNDPVPGPPGALSLEFTPAPNAAGQVPANASVTVVFAEPIDPSSIVLGKNIFLTNNTDTSPDFQLDIPSITFFDGSLTRYTFQPVFGFGTGPFNIKVNFIDPDDPSSFDPALLPTDLGGSQVQNFTFLRTFDTAFDPSSPDAGVLSEDFVTQSQRDGGNTTAIWGTDPDISFALVGPKISTRIRNVNVTNILANGGASALPDLGTGPINEGKYCSDTQLFLGPEFAQLLGFPSSNRGRRMMQIYRRAELGGAGTIIRTAWGPSADQTTASKHDRVLVRFGHKTPSTNLTGGGFFSEYDVDGFVQVTDREYTIPQSTDVNGAPMDDGYFDFPAFDLFFDYDGMNDLVLDVESTEGVATQRVRIFVGVDQVMSQPACTCGGLFSPTPSPGCSYNNSIGLRRKQSIFLGDVPLPSTTIGNVRNPGPYVQVMQFEFANLTSIGTSLYYDTGSDDPDYADAIVGPKVQPCGAVLSMRYSGSRDGVVADVPFTPNINAIDGFRYIRFEATLKSNIFTGTRGRIEVIQFPFVRQ